MPVRLLGHQPQRAHVAVVPQARRDVRVLVALGVDRAVLRAHRRPAALGLDAAVARLRPRLLDAEARAVRHLVEAVAQRLRARSRTGSKRTSWRGSRPLTRRAPACGAAMNSCSSSSIAVVEPGILPALEQLLPLLRRDLGRLGRALLQPRRVGLRAEQRAHEDPLAEVLERVVGGQEDAAGPLLADRLEREVLGVDLEPACAGSRTCAAPRGRARTSRTSTVSPPSSQPAACSTRSQPERYVPQSDIADSVAACASSALAERQAAAAAERQAVAARELPAGERAEHRLGHPQRRAAAAHVDAREERAEEAPHARPDRLRDGDARERLGDLQREPRGGRDRRGRAGQQERRHRDRLVGLGPRPHARRPSGSPRPAGCWG